MEIMCADFGCDEHWFEADGYFAAGRPPWYDAATAGTATRRALQREHVNQAGTEEESDGGEDKHCCCKTQVSNTTGACTINRPCAHSFCR